MPGINEINVNTVYQTVLSILNKEQRGYLTPFEFNNLAQQVQLEIFESYFENLNQQLRNPENSSDYANRVKLLQEKISVFEEDAAITITSVGSKGEGTFPTNLHRLGTLELEYGTKTPVQIQEVTRQEFNLSIRSNLTKPSIDWPIYYVQGNKVRILPDNPSAGALYSYKIQYIKKPEDPIWGYTIGGVGQYVYDPTAYAAGPPATGSRNFQISDVDQTELILGILRYAGIIIKDTEIVQMASGLANQQDQLEQA